MSNEVEPSFFIVKNQIQSLESHVFFFLGEFLMVFRAP